MSIYSFSSAIFYSPFFVVIRQKKGGIEKKKSFRPDACGRPLRTKANWRHGFDLVAFGWVVNWSRYSVATCASFYPLVCSRFRKPADDWALARSSCSQRDAHTLHVEFVGPVRQGFGSGKAAAAFWGRFLGFCRSMQQYRSEFCWPSGSFRQRVYSTASVSLALSLSLSLSRAL